MQPVGDIPIDPFPHPTPVMQGQAQNGQSGPVEFVVIKFQDIPPCNDCGATFVLEFDAKTNPFGIEGCVKAIYPAFLAYFSKYP